MIIICMCCNKKIGKKEPFEDKRKTHTICDDCFPLFIESIERKKALEQCKIEWANGLKDKRVTIMEARQTVWEENHREEVEE